MENITEALKELDSFKFDVMLNNSVGFCNHCKLCNSENINIKDEPWFKFFCYQFARNVQTLYEIININSGLKEKRCKTLIYWIHDKITNFYNKHKINAKQVDIFSEILKVWNNIHSSNIKDQKYTCDLPGKENSADLSKMKRIKIMSDYCENYDELKNLLTKKINVNCNIYYNYFKKNFSEFSKIAEEHNTECLEINYCSNLCQNYDPYDLLNKSKCSTIEISPGKNDYIKLEDCNASIGHALSEKTCESKEMTPFRSWISRKLGKKKIISGSFNEQSDDESLDANYESVDRNMENAGYNIIYNSDWSSSR
ncbi:PIR Superfamily Protein [Plasmodium ovale curtisi]|uniref:PIR Superfamily Protein n=1 Tax=Plasmodium ovale curtisi TaxID=864141 RepID=A0A1A8WVN9_PLAOA|nr:PIR Superfamily Protein [Plasmodium ovale curtisi]